MQLHRSSRGLLLSPQVHVHLRGPWDREDCHCTEVICCLQQAAQANVPPFQYIGNQWHEADRTPPSLRANLAGEQSLLSFLGFILFGLGCFWSSSLRDPSSPTRDSTQALSSESAESQHWIAREFRFELLGNIVFWVAHEKGKV